MTQKLSIGCDNAGMSNVEDGEIPSGRMPKVYESM